MNVIKLTPRGYCKGVVRAIQLVKEARKSYQGDIFILGMIVHNTFVSKSLENYGVISLDTSFKSKEEWIDSLDHGLLVFTAHGISPQLKQRAIDRGLDVLDASCFDVLRTQNLIAEHRNLGYEVIYVGKHGHPEAEAMKANDPMIHIIENETELESLPTMGENILVTNQTTMSLLDIARLMANIKLRYPNAIIHEEICDSTRVRQEAVLKLKDATVLVIVGDARSNNSNRLHQINQNIQRRYIIESIADLDLSWFEENDHIAISSGASTPTYITNQVIEFLEQYDISNPETHNKPVVDIHKIL